MPCSSCIQPPSPLAVPFLAQQDEQTEGEPINLDTLPGCPRRWKRRSPLFVRFLKKQVLNKQMEVPVVLHFHIFVGPPDSGIRYYVTRKASAMRRLSEYVHVDFTNETKQPVEMTIVCQTFDQGDRLVFQGKNVSRWKGYCDIHGNNKRIKKGWQKRFKAQLLKTEDGFSLAFSNVPVTNHPLRL